jgi:hypothetical protein
MSTNKNLGKSLAFVLRLVIGSENVPNKPDNASGEGRGGRELANDPDPHIKSE